ncbi:MAG: ribbon-helix-helix protein, CopG family [Coriobacteriia bacterium]|jgi:metal-responsive CopG/Arc/MetJ family transcriptional regulator|nr:ribbon-helix-helix protein, CopG family [Coriobacteriia bacterium]
MKTAISIPDDLFGEADALAQKLNKSRSEVYSQAVREYLARHADDRITEALDALYAAEEPSNEFASRAARSILEDSEW